MGVHANAVERLLNKPNLQAMREYLGITSATGGGSVTSADFVSLQALVIANSAQMTSADVALRSAVDAVSNRLSTWRLDDLADVSAPAPTDQQVLLFNSAQNQWVASTIAAGAGSVTSAELASVAAGLSARIDSVNTVVSNQGSAIVANSAQMTSSDNANSAAIAAVSVRLNSTNTVVSNQGSAIVANSAQMTSADNAISAAAAAVSVRLDSTNTVVSNLVSQANAISNRISTLVLDSLANVSAPAPTDQQFLIFNSAQNQWVASTVAPGGSSVTSAELSALLPIKRVLAGDQLVTATAPVSISGFTFTVSGGVGYSFEFGLYRSASTSLAGTKLVLSAPAGAIFGVFRFGGAADSGLLNSAVIIDNTNITAAQITVSAVGAPKGILCRGTLRPTANGTVAMAIGNNVTASTAASAITLLSGSYGFLWRMV